MPAGAASSTVAVPAVVPGRLGRCAASFWLALALDALGLSVLLSGVFADAAFSDLLVYGGGLGIFLSLVGWVFWYVGNLEVPPEELRDDDNLGRDRPPGTRAGKQPGAAASRRRGLRGRLRSLSRRLSSAFSLPGDRGASSDDAPVPVTAVRSTAAVELELEPV